MYYHRLIEDEIALKLKTSGAVLVAGPKFCGKTTTCMLFQKSFVKLNTKQAISMARLNPKAVLEGEKPRLIDEWQTVPDIWNHVKDDLDFDYQFGKYILTGSTTPADKTEVYHSGVGRVTPLRMRPMTLWESKESKGTVSLKDLFDGESAFPWDLNSEFTLDDVAFLLCRGGWPISVLASKEIALEITKNYYNGLFLFEESENERFRNKRPEVLRMIIRSTPTRHFTDTSIACRSLGIGPEDLKNDLTSFDLFFEDFAVRDLRVYADSLGGIVRHYRDNAGLECDAVVHLDDGRWGGVEIKLGGEERIEEGARSLRLLKDKIVEKSDEKEPFFLLVLTAVGGAYRREDGVYVAPINLLRP